MSETIVYPRGYVEVNLPPEEMAVAYAIGYGGVAAAIPARLMKANVDMLGWKAPVNFGAGRDSQSDRATWLSNIGTYVTLYAPDRPVGEEKQRSFLHRILGITDEIIERDRPPLFQMIGGSLPSRVTPYGHRPDKMAKDFELWRRVVESDVFIIRDNMRRKRAPLGSLGILGRSVGSHEIAGSYAGWLLGSQLSPNYVVSLLPVFPTERDELISYFDLIKEWGLPRNELLLLYSPNPEIGLVKSDVAFLTTFILNAMCSQRPDVITLIEKARKRGPFAGMMLKVGHIPIRTLEKKGKILWVIPVSSDRSQEPDKDYTSIVETLLSQVYLETQEIGKPIAIFIHGPFTKKEAETMQETYHYKDCPIIFGGGGTFKEGYFAEVYSISFYNFDDPKTFPPYVRSSIGYRSLDEIPSANGTYMKQAYETLSKFTGVEPEKLFRREAR